MQGVNTILAVLIFAHLTFARISSPVSNGQYNDNYDDSKDYDAYPKYKYAYGVDDEKTGDYKTHEEERDGDVVKGVYTVADPDGTIRTVRYTSDKTSGFQAVVTTTKADGTPIQKSDYPSQPEQQYQLRPITSPSQYQPIAEAPKYYRRPQQTITHRQSNDESAVKQVTVTLAPYVYKPVSSTAIPYIYKPTERPSKSYAELKVSAPKEEQVQYYKTPDVKPVQINLDAMKPYLKNPYEFLQRAQQIYKKKVENSEDKYSNQEYYNN